MSLEYDPEFVDPRRAPGGKSNLQGRLNDGFDILTAGDDEHLDDQWVEGFQQRYARVPQRAFREGKA